MIKSTGYLFEKVAYISDCNKIPKESIKNLYGLDYLIIDCLKRNKHPSHFNYDDALELIRLVKPKKAKKPTSKKLFNNPFNQLKDIDAK